MSDGQKYISSLSPSLREPETYVKHAKCGSQINLLLYGGHEILPRTTFVYIHLYSFLSLFESGDAEILSLDVMRGYEDLIRVNREGLFLRISFHVSEYNG